MMPGSVTPVLKSAGGRSTALVKRLSQKLRASPPKRKACAPLIHVRLSAHCQTRILRPEPRKPSTGSVTCENVT